MLALEMPQHELERKIIFDNAISIAKTIVQMLAYHCEIAIHDFTDLNHSLIHIEGSITGREIGAPVTNLVINAWRQQGNDVKDIIGYPTITKAGQRMKSSTTFLRNKNNEVIGAFCMNLDITEFESIRNIFQNLIRMDTICSKYSKESFAVNAYETSDAIIEASIRKAGKHPSVMTRAERINFIHILDNEGAFLIKGMVHAISSIMNVSIYTVYNYMHHVKSNSKQE